MKNILFIAVKDFQYMLKDKSVLIWLFIMPLVFFAFIGTTTKGFGGSSQNQQVSLAVWYEGDEEDALAKQIFTRLEAENFSLRHFSTAKPLHNEKWTIDDYSRKLWLPSDMSELIKKDDVVLSSKNI